MIIKTILLTKKIKYLKEYFGDRLKVIEVIETIENSSCSSVEIELKYYGDLNRIFQAGVDYEYDKIRRLHI